MDALALCPLASHVGVSEIKQGQDIVRIEISALPFRSSALALDSTERL